MGGRDKPGSRPSKALPRLVASAKYAGINRQNQAAAASRAAGVCPESSGCKVDGPGDGAVRSSDESQRTAKKRLSESQATSGCLGTLPRRPQLPPDLQLYILRLLPAQERACSARLLCKAAAARFSEPAHRTVKLGLPMSLHVAQQWQAGAEPRLRQLSFKGKLISLSTAASSGCEANLEAVWALVGPGLAPELLPPESGRLVKMITCEVGGRDPGSAAASAGHMHLLPWLLHHRLPLHPERTLVAAAPHGDLAALQDTLLLLHSRMDHSGRFMDTHKALVSRVAAGGGPHAIPKLEWLLSCGAERPDKLDLGEARRLVCQSAFQAAEPAHILMWARGRGVDLRGLPPVTYALGPCDISVLEWLVDEVGCPLPKVYGEGDEGSNEDEDEDEEVYADAAAQNAAAGGRVDNLRWLQQQGVVLGQLGEPGKLLSLAVEVGHLGAVRFLHEECGISLLADAKRGQPLGAAMESGSVELVAWLWANGLPLTPRAVTLACWYGNLPMLRWLLQEAHCSVTGLTVGELASSWAVHGGQEGCSGESHLLQAVQLLLQAGCRMGVGKDALAGAASRGDLATCRYLLEEKRVRLGPWVPFYAAQSGCEEVLEWLAAAAGGCKKWGRKGKDPYLAAGYRADLATLRCLRRLGAPLRRGLLVEAAAADCPLSVLQLLVEWGGAPGRVVAGRALVAAREKGAVPEVVAWLSGLQAGRR